MTREDEDKMYADQYRFGPKGKPETVEQAIARAERSESQLRIVEGERDQLMNSLKVDFAAHVATAKLLQEALDALELCMDGSAHYQTVYAIVTAVLDKAGRRK